VNPITYTKEKDKTGTLVH